MREKHGGILKSLLIEQAGMPGCEADALLLFQTSVQRVHSAIGLSRGCRRKTTVTASNGCFQLRSGSRW